MADAVAALVCDQGPTQSPSIADGKAREGEFGSGCNAASATLKASRRSGVGSGDEGMLGEKTEVGGRTRVWAIVGGVGDD